VSAFEADIGCVRRKSLALKLRRARYAGFQVVIVLSHGSNPFLGVLGGRRRIGRFRPNQVPLLHAQLFIGHAHRVSRSVKSRRKNEGELCQSPLLVLHRRSTVKFKTG